MTKNLRWSSCKVPCIFLELTKLEFSLLFSKCNQISIFMKIRPLEAELSHADGWTDRRRDRQDVANSRF